jgi:AcrR family transcriptional regulator
MVVGPTRDRRAERREATRAEILDTAWDLARTEGLAGLSLRDIAARIGMRPPSLYWYFDSKNAVFDAMFADGYRTLLDRIATEDWPDEPRASLNLTAKVIIEFMTEDAARAALLFQRTIPDFEPSAESYALAVEVVEQGKARFAAAGVTDPAAFDLWTALVSGLASQQLANDPGGDRWIRLIDDFVTMFANYCETQRLPRTRPPARSRTKGTKR